jgi:AmmeMemoRadiSam system protein A
MTSDELSQQEKETLLALARRSLEMSVSGQGLTQVDLSNLSPRLAEDGVCFVTLFGARGELRGCIGGLEATRPLAQDVCDHAAAAALEDYRFESICPNEVPEIKIEISVLSQPRSLGYDSPADLPGLLRPGVDGVVLRDGLRRATYLPQVWEKIACPQAFLDSLCQKMGAPADLWRKKKLTVETYQVDEFRE